MRFDWKDYVTDTMSFVEDWLDDCAVRMTGIEDGWKAFHEYWVTDGEMTLGKDYWCKVVYCNDSPYAVIPFAVIPFAVIALSLFEGNYHIMELLVKPEMRGKGLGTALLGELLSNGEMIVGEKIVKASAVIFPDNSASQKAFEKAGFALDHSHEEGDHWYWFSSQAQA